MMGPDPSSIYADEGFINNKGFVGTAFPNSLAWSLKLMYKLIKVR